MYMYLYCSFCNTQASSWSSRDRPTRLPHSPMLCLHSWTSVYLWTGNHWSLMMCKLSTFVAMSYKKKMSCPCLWPTSKVSMPRLSYWSTLRTTTPLLLSSWKVGGVYCSEWPVCLYIVQLILLYRMSTYMCVQICQQLCTHSVYMYTFVDAIHRMIRLALINIYVELHVCTKWKHRVVSLSKVLFNLSVSLSEISYGTFSVSHWNDCMQ